MDNQDFCIYIIDDDKGMRDSLTWLVKSVGYQACAFENAESFLNNIPDNKLGCIITDIRMPGLSGLALYKKLQKIQFQLPVIIITGHGDISIAVNALKVEKPFSDEVILESIRLAVMHKIVAGMSNKQIAAALNISIKTVEVHRSRVMDKMQAGSLAALVRMSLKI